MPKAHWGITHSQRTGQNRDLSQSSCSRNKERNTEHFRVVAHLGQGEPWEILVHWTLDTSIHCPNPSYLLTTLPSTSIREGLPLSKQQGNMHTTLLCERTHLKWNPQHSWLSMPYLVLSQKVDPHFYPPWHCTLCRLWLRSQFSLGEENLWSQPPTLWQAQNWSQLILPMKTKRHAHYSHHRQC